MITVPTPNHGNDPPWSSGCDDEPIHRPGAIQPHGGLLVCTLPQWTVVAVSANMQEFLGLEAHAMLGMPLESLLRRNIVHDLRNVLQAAMASGVAEWLNRVALGAESSVFDLAIHLAGPHVIIEVLLRPEAETSITEPLSLVKNMITRLGRAPSLERFFHLAAHQLRALSGFDRVMVYKFLDNGSGQVVAEALRARLPPRLGFRYPASDIPAQARALYVKQSLRHIPDVGAVPVPLLTQPGFVETVDLSLAALRCPSPIHLDYLRNMGSCATLTISLLTSGKLWGFLACHHVAPRRISASTCTAAELFGQVFSLGIEAREQARDGDAVARMRDGLEPLVASMTADHNLFDDLPSFMDGLQRLVPCDGVAVRSGRGSTLLGSGPSEEALPGLFGLLDALGTTQIFATECLGEGLPEAQAYASAVSGVLAIPFAQMPRAYLIFFRRESAQTIVWGGDPTKASASEGRIQPRESFEAWRETVRGRSAPWRPAELRIAEALRVALLDILLRRACGGGDIAVAPVPAAGGP